ncbi:extracellular solute-binding protein [Paenibacillus barcinonensis]|uniref:ABC transporter substrate-binding protein n=1 Tax=Paenibacillus TaxID=44249 RepID=UPI001C11AB9E|nr:MULTISPECIES: extracellular solute-binding protein [Paenibacillus]MBU5352526.1 extracellular solute-binding protein [Paenibacillus barcinonensis]MDM5276749.1 extracellular solute-binding protein [Paenibacillus silvae]
MVIKGKRWLKTLTMGVLAAVMVTGCAGGSNSGASEGQGSGPLKMMWWGSDARHEATKKAIELYTSKHTDVKLTTEFTSWDGYWQKLPTLAASSSLPDILQMDAAYIQGYAKRGQLADLSDLDLSGIVDEKVLENIKIDGKLYGVPLSYNGAGLVYDKVTLEQYGIKLPFNNWTWDDFFAYAKEARSKLPEDKYPIDDLRNIWEFYQFYQTAKGKGPIFQDGKFNLDKDTFFEFNNTYAEFQKEGVVPPADQQLAFKENDPQLDSLGSGKVMLRTASVGSASAIEALKPGQLAVNSNPIGESGGGWAQSTIFFSISANSKNVEQAKEFIKWFISDPEAGKILGMTRGIPINDEVYASLETNLTDGERFGKELLDVAKPKALPFYPAPPGAEDFTATYKSEMESVMFGKVTLDAAYDVLVEKGKQAEAKMK